MEWAEYGVGPIFEWGGWRQQPDWSKLDEILDLSGQYQLPVVAVLRTTPAQLSTCPNDPNPGRCAPTDHERYGSLAAAIASHARGVIRHWEALNEPDRRWDFHGTASDYAWTLRRTYDAIKSVAPEDQVLIGGITSPKSLRWLSRVFATPGADALRRFDIANVHLRGTLDSLRQAMTQFRAFFSGHGFHGPLWVTEHGYPGATPLPARSALPRGRAGSGALPAPVHPRVGARWGRAGLRHPARQLRGGIRRQQIRFRRCVAHRRLGPLPGKAQARLRAHPEAVESLADTARGPTGPRRVTHAA